MNAVDQRLEDEELSLEQRILSESEEGASEYLRTSWFFRAMEAIRDARIRNGLTQQEVAEKIGTTQSVIARLENAHEGNFSLKRFLEYAWASGAAPLDFAWVSPDELRAFALMNPSAPRTEETVRLWTTLRRVWGLNLPEEGQWSLPGALLAPEPLKVKWMRESNQFPAVGNTPPAVRIAFRSDVCEPQIGNAPLGDERTSRLPEASRPQLAS